MRLEDFPIPRNKSKRAMHWSASCYPEEAHWRERLALCRDMGVGWIKFVDDGGGSGINVYRACWHEFGIIPIVRFYIGTPGNCGPREADAISRIADVLGFATYFELCNEPDLPLEWNYEQPKNWLYLACDAYCDYAPKVLAAGGLPGTFALASGAFGQMRVDEQGNEIPPVKVNFLKIIHDKNPYIFGYGGWVSMHNYHINHPVDYPYDAVNQAGIPLTQAEYDAAPPWAWDYRPIESLNIQRARDKNPGDTIWEDDTCFRAYMVFLAHLAELNLYEVPVLTTEGGPTMTRGDDGRYAKTYPQLHADLVEQTYREMGPLRQYFGYAHWLLYNTTGGWGTDCWMGGSQDYTLTIDRMRTTPVGAWGETLIFDGTTPPPEPPEPPEEEPMPEIPETVIDVPEDWGVEVEKVVPVVGKHYVVCSHVRLLPPEENLGNHNIYINVVDAAGARLYNSTVEIENTGNGWRGQVPMEKPWPEPMGNYPMQKGDTMNAWVSRAGGWDVLSDRVTGMHTRHEDLGAGSTYGHHSYELTFVYVGEYTGEVEPPEPPPPEVVTEQDIRNAAWNRAYPTGIAFNPDAAFQAAARAFRLGAPVTNEFDIGEYRAQGFALGILYAVIGNWDDVTMMDW